MGKGDRSFHPPCLTGSPSGAAAVGARRVPLSSPCLPWGGGGGLVLRTTSASPHACPGQHPGIGDREKPRVKAAAKPRRPAPAVAPGPAPAPLPSPELGTAGAAEGSGTRCVSPPRPGRVPSGDLQETAPTKSAVETRCPFILLDI